MSVYNGPFVAPVNETKLSPFLPAKPYRCRVIFAYRGAGWEWVIFCGQAA